MTISLTFKLKDHSWIHGDLVSDFIAKYLKAYFGKDNIEIVGPLTSWKKVGVRFGDNVIAHIQDLVEIAHDKFSDAVDVIGTDFYNDIDNLVNARDPYRIDANRVKEWAESESFESIRFGVDVMFD